MYFEGVIKIPAQGASLMNGQVSLEACLSTLLLTCRCFQSWAAIICEALGRRWVPEHCKLPSYPTALLFLLTPSPPSPALPTSWALLSATLPSPFYEMSVYLLHRREEIGTLSSCQRSPATIVSSSFLHATRNDRTLWFLWMRSILLQVHNTFPASLFTSTAAYLGVTRAAANTKCNCVHDINWLQFLWIHAQ